MVRLSPKSRVWIEGDSTLHKFKADAAEMRASFDIMPVEGDIEARLRAGAVRGFDFTVPVRSLQSGTSGLDDSMWSALKAEKQPAIRFQVRSYRVFKSYEKDAAFLLRMSGRLSIAGTEKEMSVEAQAVRSPGGLRLVGKQPLTMSAFGIRPPVMMMGLLKVKDAIVVNFDVQVADDQR